MAKLEVTLKQHTPLIHFESDVDGATLRATELKPKLDKFLTENIFKWEYDKFKEFLIGDKKKYKQNKFDKYKLNPAFNYKVKIKPNGKNNEENLQIEDFKLYFGNMGQLKEKDFSFFDNIKVEFFSFNKELIDLIESKLSQFLLTTNFGARQGKGFGSFYKEDSNNESYLRNYYDYYLKIIKNNVLQAFKDVDKEYKKIRNGGNFDPKIKEYFKDIEWEKTKINRKLIGNKAEKECYLIKDLLGLSTNEDWKKQGNLVKKCISNSEIERFQSPIFFKIIKSNSNYLIYIKLNNSNIINEKFELYFKENENKKIKIDTPLKFDIYDFFEYCMKNGAFSKAKKAGDK